MKVVRTITTTTFEDVNVTPMFEVDQKVNFSDWGGINVGTIQEIRYRITNEGARYEYLIQRAWISEDEIAEYDPNYITF